ncbi:MAG: hypothetical protein RIQ88_234 [Actinomycetota bacterium]
MKSLEDLFQQHGEYYEPDLEWLQALVADWQVVADLSFADLVLWIPDHKGGFIAAGHARPSSTATLFYRDITSKAPEASWFEVIENAYTTGEISINAQTDTYEGVIEQVSAIPVFRKLNVASGADLSPAPIAVITRHSNLSEVNVPNRMRTNFTKLGEVFAEMIVAGNYPVFSTQGAPRRGRPRVIDGLVSIDQDGLVLFASPNGISAFQKLGVRGEMEGRLLKDVIDELNQGRLAIDESLPKVVSGKVAWRADVEGNNSALAIRAIPMFQHDKRIGAILLCRDVTELRKQERELITKDATIREIHHRVKNNLQTVASLLRIQGRRTKSEETLESLGDAERRVSAIAVVHDSLSEGLAQDVNFDEVFDRIITLVGELAAAFNAKVTNLRIGKFGRLPSEFATPLAVVLTELVTNAYEHGLANKVGHLTVTAKRSESKLTITVADDGVGFDADLPLTGLGTQLVKTLVESELRGKIEFRSEKTGGTTVQLELPIN